MKTSKNQGLFLSWTQFNSASGQINVDYDQTDFTYLGTYKVI